MLQKGFFNTQSYNPNLPDDEWTLVQEIATAGGYNTSIGWGKYKIVFSGGGGGGAAAAWSESSGTRYANAGSTAEESTIFVNVLKNNNLTLTGTIGAGGGGGRADWNTPSGNAGGVGGAGYQNGANGTNQRYVSYEGAATSGGGGGGSTSVGYNGGWVFARGGNGGNARFSKFSIWGYGGTGGSGGVSSGTGAAGGAGKSAYSTSQQVASPGSDGYVRIYKSQLYPEPL